ncbi:MAG: tRNA (adenosine(37)-N6)-threonylcarbamoyltransferase complex dimerization subunit type 1 TsaB [Patescibacteria group bacterium]
MILIINTTSNDHLEIILAGRPADFKVKKIPGKFNQAEKLLPAIAKLLAAEKIKPEGLKAIGVVVGPGGFTSVRIGVAAANGLGYGLRVPVVGIKSAEFSDQRELVAKIFARAKSSAKSKLARPFYDREPNITMAKK